MTHDNIEQRIKKPFKFYNFLLQNEGFIEMLRELWYSLNVMGSAMLRLSKKLKAAKNHIRDFSKQRYSELEKRVAEAHNVLLSCQDNTLLSPNQVNVVLELEAQRKIILATAEESFFCQRSRITWLKKGDSNTNYFHRMVDSMYQLNHIHFLMDESIMQICLVERLALIC